MPRMKSRVRIEGQDPLCALVLKGWGKENHCTREGKEIVSGKRRTEKYCYRRVFQKEIPNVKTL